MEGGLVPLQEYNKNDFYAPVWALVGPGTPWGQQGRAPHPGLIPLPQSEPGSWGRWGSSRPRHWASLWGRGQTKARPACGAAGLWGDGDQPWHRLWGLKWCPELWIGSGETQGSKQGLSGLLVPSGTGQPLIKQEQLHNSWTLRMHCVIYEHAIFFQVSPDAFWYFFVAFKLLAFPFTVEPFGCQSHFQPYFCLCSCLVSALSLAHPTSQFFQVKNCMEEATGYAQDVSFILCVIKKQYHIQAGTNLVILHFSP